MMLAKTTTFPLGRGKEKQLTLVGRSRAGDGTGFAIPELRWLFDCGALIQGWKPKVVFLSHAHSDHAHFLTHTKNPNSPTIIYLPSESESFVRSHLHAYQEMIDCMTETESQNGGTYPLEYKLCATVPGEEMRLRQGGTEYIIRPYRMEHRIPCLGYGIFKVRNELKAEYKSLAGKEVGRLRKAGVQVTSPKAEPLVCFMGDTTAAAFASNPEVLEQHRYIIVECSFIDDESVERAKTTKHMHWNDLRPYIQAHSETMFVLTHFSLKYSSLRLRQFFCNAQVCLDNLHPMLIQSEVEEEWQRAGRRNEGNPPTCNCRSCRKLSNC